MLKVELLSLTPNALQLIEIAGRTSYQSYNKIGEGSADKFIRMILKQKPFKHESVFEHAKATFGRV